MSEWKVYVEDKPWEMSATLHMVRDTGDGLDVVEPLTLKRMDRFGLSAPSRGILGDATREEAFNFLRAIMDQAWEMGIRPTKFKDHTNELKAVRDHLQDMRKLAKVAG